MKRLRKHIIKDTDNLDDIYDKDNPNLVYESKSLIKYRTKTIRSGDMLECEIYPIWRTRAEARKAKDAISRKSQKYLNHKNKVKKAIRLINTNFTDSDMWATFTYSDNNLPSSYDDALKEMQKYIRRLKNYAVKHDYPELKYIYVTEVSKKGRYHHHIVMNFVDRDIAESLWKGGKRKQTRRLQSDDSGYEGLARYITKQDKATHDENRQTYVCSKNLKKPIITISDTKISRRKAKQIATGAIDPLKLFQKLYPDYKYKDIVTKYSEFVSGEYIYVKMHRFRI